MAAKQNGEILNHGFRERQGLPSNPDDPVMSQRQQEHKTEDFDNVDSVRRDSFIARALSESSRMSKEAERCCDKRDRVRAMFGERRTSFSANERQIHAPATQTSHTDDSNNSAA